MNKAEKEVARTQLTAEERTLKELIQVYNRAKQDVEQKIKELNSRTDMQNLSSIVYQMKYQNAILTQINTTLNVLKNGIYSDINEYFDESYQNGYIGMMYELQKQGIPVTVPIDDTKVVRALTTDSKLSTTYYSEDPLKGRVAENVDLLKTRIRSNLSRGIVEGKSWLDVAVDIASGMNNPFDMALRDTIRIVRTEGHRINQQGYLDAGNEAQSKGAKIYKQWDATLDDRTREDHQIMDGQIVPWGEYFIFKPTGAKVEAPSKWGDPKEDINCRCQLLQRAEWAMDEAELKTLKEKASYYGLDKTDSFEEYKRMFNIMEEQIERDNTIRQLPDLEFESEVSGINLDENSNISYNQTGVDEFGGKEGTITINKNLKIEWDQLPKETQTMIRWYNPSRYGKSVTLKSGEYSIFQFVNRTNENDERMKIAEALGSEYIGSNFYKYYDRYVWIDFYQNTDGQIQYSFGKANVQKTLTAESLQLVIALGKERESIIIDALEKQGVSVKNLTYRSGDDWCESMKEYHRIVNADGSVDIVSDVEYNSNPNVVLYRGIAPQSSLRGDITTTLTTEQMANEFFTGDTPFPSRGIYGDGVAYCSPSYEKIALNYATNGGSQHGGVVIEFKLKEDAKVIEYDEALSLFQKVSGSEHWDLLFNPKQRNAPNTEVGKAMNALGYDAIIKHNGDNTGQDFYVILNRGSLMTKTKYYKKV